MAQLLRMAGETMTTPRAAVQNLIAAEEMKRGKRHSDHVNVMQFPFIPSLRGVGRVCPSCNVSKTLALGG